MRWATPRLVCLAAPRSAAGGHLPGITEDGHIHGNSAIHRDPDTPSGLIVGGAS